MPPSVAALACFVLVLGLLWLERGKRDRTSPAVWISVVWVSLAASRFVSQWLGMAPLSSPELYLEGSPLDRAILAAILLAGLIVLVQRGSRVRAILASNPTILVFVAYCAISVIWSDYPDVSLKRWFKFIGDFVMVLIVLTDGDPVVAFRRFFARVGFLLLPVSYLLIKYFPDLGRTYSRWDGALSYTGVSTDKNMLGMVCLVFGTAAFWRVLSEYRKKKLERRKAVLFAHGLILALVLWHFFRINSMTSLSCFLMASFLITATILVPRVRKTALVHVLVVAVIVVAFSALFLNFGSGIVQSMGRDSTLTGRTGLWDVLIKFNRQPVLGAGFEGFWLGDRLNKIWALIPWQPNEAHNGYLEVFLNLGAVGLFLLFTVAVTGYGKVIGLLRRNPELGSIRLAYFVLALVYNFTEAGFRMMSPMWLAFLFAVFEVPTITQRKISVADAAPLEQLNASQQPQEVS